MTKQINGFTWNDEPVETVGNKYSGVYTGVKTITRDGSGGKIITIHFVTKHVWPSKMTRLIGNDLSD